MSSTKRLLVIKPVTYTRVVQHCRYLFVFCFSHIRLHRSQKVFYAVQLLNYVEFSDNKYTDRLVKTRTHTQALLVWAPVQAGNWLSRQSDIL